MAGRGSGHFDVAIEGGTIVTPSGHVQAHLYVREGRIAAVGTDRLGATSTFDAAGLLVLPGMVDAHVHFMDPGDTSREDFPTGSAAALRAGVTTVIEHTHAHPVRTGEDLADKRRHVEARSRVDFALAAHAWPGELAAVEDAWRAGAAFVKAFTCSTHGVPAHDAAALRALLARAAALEAPCLVHCEDESLTAQAERVLREAGRDDPKVVPEWRSRDAEATALAVLAVLARSTGAPVVAAHVSNADSADELARARAGGARIAVETCPQYLTLLEREVVEHDAFRKFTPPARARDEDDLLHMWRALADGTVDYVASDHAPSTAAQKRAGSIWDVHFGLPGIDTTFSILLDGAHEGLLGHERLVELYSQRPAQLYGLYPRKGSLRPGADADVVLVDPEVEWTIADADIVSKAGWTPYVGRRVRGRVVRTYARGVLAVDERSVLAEPGQGRFLPGPGA